MSNALLIERRLINHERVILGSVSILICSLRKMGLHIGSGDI